MGLRDDLEIMERHQRNGTLRQWFEGTAPQLPPEPWPTDPSAAESGSTYQYIKNRGD